LEERDHLLEVRRTAMVDNRHTAEVQIIFARGRANLFFVAEERDACETLRRAVSGGRDRAWIIPFGKNDVLRSGSGALANAFENVHA
jgi:hypothetical protein